MDSETRAAPMERETRAVRGLELRAADAADAGIVTLDGYASVAGVWYDVAGGPDAYGWREQIQRGAFTKTLTEQLDAMFLLFDHDGLPLAGTRNGSLELDEDEHGLRVAARIDTRTAGYRADFAATVAEGLVDSMSFAFMATRQEWNGDYTERTITELRLYEVSAVKWPANPATVAQLRSHVAALREQRPPSDGGVGMSLARAQALALSIA